MAKIKNKETKNIEFFTVEYVTLRSNVTYPVPFEYDGKTAFVPPMGIIKKVDKSKLGKLPNTIRIVY